MLICQISDLHVRRPGELAYRRVDTAMLLRKCVEHVLAQPMRPDVVVVTGDLADSGRIEEYEHLADMLAPLPMPIYVIPGNHDDRRAMRAVFGGRWELSGSDEFMQYTVHAGPVALVALDTTVAGDGGGLLCERRLRWLERELFRLRGVPTVLLMHHPPFPTGIGHMDRVGLKTEYPLEPIIQRNPNIERILCGHLHRSIIRRLGGTLAMTCPSPAHQVVLDFSADAASQFVLEPPGYLLHRWQGAAGLTSFGVVIGSYEGPYPFYENGKLME